MTPEFANCYSKVMDFDGWWTGSVLRAVLTQKKKDVVSSLVRNLAHEKK
jgi:hypothetical protein